MTRCILFDDKARTAFLPFTFSRPLSEMRFGIMTFREKWEEALNSSTSWLTVPYLRKKFPFYGEEGALLLNGSAAPDVELLDRIEALEAGEALLSNERLLALKLGKEDPEKVVELYDRKGVEGLRAELAQSTEVYNKDHVLLQQRWELFSRNGEALKADHERLKMNRSSMSAPSGNQVIGDDLFISEGARLSHAVLNTETGPVHIGEGAEVMEGAMIRGPFYLGPHATVKMGAKIYGPTTVGPYGKVGGEVNNSVIFGYSNKAHEGFIGNSVIGEWCNLGADTNNSNLKNNYGEVKVWDYEREAFEKSGLTFCGIFMGDHSKCGIDTMFNTGTTIGFSANVFDAGFPPKFIPSFFWGGKEAAQAFELSKAKEVAERVRARRGLAFDEIEEGIFDAVHEMTSAHRQAAL